MTSRKSSRDSLSPSSRRSREKRGSARARSFLGGNSSYQVDMANTTELQLCDQASGTLYKLIVSEEVSRRACNDLVFATKLLEEVKARERCVESVEERLDLPSTSAGPSKGAEDDEMLAEEADNNDDGNFRWGHQAILLLLATYKEEEASLTSGKVSVKKWWDRISSVLKEKGVIASGPQCKSKVNGMKKCYKNIKDHNKKSGNSRRNWPYYEHLDQMFRERPWVTPVLTLDTTHSRNSSGGSSSPGSGCDSPASGSASPATGCASHDTPQRKGRKRKVSENVDAFVEALEKSNAARREMHMEAMRRQDRLLELLNKLINK